MDLANCCSLTVAGIVLFEGGRAVFLLCELNIILHDLLSSLLRPVPDRHQQSARLEFPIGSRREA